MQPPVIALFVAGLVLARLVAENWLARLNRRHVLAHADAVPPGLKETMDEATYARSVQYTLAKNRLSQFEDIYHTIILLVVLFGGMLPWAFQAFSSRFGESAWAMAGFLFVVGVVIALPDLPLEWFAQFRLEEQFGFNTTTQKTWWLDRMKGLLLALALGFPLLVLVLKVVEWTGNGWWLWAWGTLLAFQFMMMVLAPVLILPLFNKFTPLPQGSLRDRLLKLAERTSFRARDIQVMDGSRRSRHSNAFFIGFGRFRKIGLFDTLVQQLGEPEIEAVLAHEIGHYKKKHMVKMLLGSALGSLMAFYAISILVRQEWFYRAFGFAPGNIGVALLLFGLLAGAVTFWFSPLLNGLSRRYEYQADAFAAQVMNEPRSLIRALRTLTEKNLSNLTPHPLYSAFYYSHPTLLERELALNRHRQPSIPEH